MIEMPVSLFVDGRLCRRDVGFGATAEGITETSAGFVNVDAIVVAWAAVGVVAEHVATKNITEAIADIGLQVAGQVDGSTGHKRISEAPLVTAAMFETVIAVAGIAGFAAGVPELVPANPGAADTGADIGCECAVRADIDIGIGHHAPAG